MTQAPAGEGLHFERIVFFSDAVFAIAITLLVLEIKVPHAPPGAPESQLAMLLLQLLPKLIGFVVSFLVVGSMWIEHHRVFRYVAGYDAGLLWRNLVFLLAVAFMPFPTALFSENHTTRLALATYATSLALVGLAKLWVWSYAARGRRLLSPEVPAEVVRRVSRRSWAVPLTCLATAVLAGTGVPLAYMAFMLIPLVAWLLDRSGAPRGRRTPP